MTDDHERRLERLEARQDMTDVAVEALQNAFDTLSTAFTDYATATNQTIADILAHEAEGGTITGSELTPITEGATALAQAVEAATATVAGEDPGPEPAQPTTENVTVPIDAAGEGSVQLEHNASLVTITTQPESGTASLEAVEVEGQPNATKLTVTGATPETTVSVVLSVAAE